MIQKFWVVESRIIENKDNSNQNQTKILKISTITKISPKEILAIPAILKNHGSKG